MNWQIIDDMAWLTLAAVGCWYIACGIFTGVRCLTRYFRADTIADYTLLELLPDPVDDKRRAG